MEDNYKKPLTILLWLLVVAVATSILFMIVMMTVSFPGRIEYSSSVTEIPDASTTKTK